MAPTLYMNQAAVLPPFSINTMNRLMGDGGSVGTIAVYVHDSDSHMVEVYWCIDRARPRGRAS